MNRAMGESQRGILDHLKRRGESTIPALAEDLGLSVETVRAHVRSLGSEGLVRRAGTRRRGPGRPEVLYELTKAADRWFPNREGEVLQEFAKYLEGLGKRDLVDRFFAEYVSTRRSEAMVRVKNLQGALRVREVAQILTEDGFMAEVEEDEPGQAVLRLSHCPLRGLVDVTTAPCRAELTFVRQLLGGSPTRVKYMPKGDAACCYAVSVGT